MLQRSHGERLQWRGIPEEFFCERNTARLDLEALGANTGAWNRFSFALPGEPTGKTCELVVRFDDREPCLPRGKPAHLASIWQTVWLEPVPKDHICGFHQTPDIDAEQLTIDVSVSPYHPLCPSWRRSVVSHGKKPTGEALRERRLPGIRPSPMGTTPPALRKGIAAHGAPPTFLRAVPVWEGRRAPRRIRKITAPC